MSKREQVRRDIQRPASRSTIGRDGPPVIGSSQPKPLPEGEVCCTFKLACLGVKLEPTRRAGKMCADCAKVFMAKKREQIDAKASAAREGRELRRAPTAYQKMLERTGKKGSHR